MQLTAIGPAAPARDMLSAMPDVIESVGRREFAPSLFALTRRFTGTENLTAFVATPDGQVHTLLAEDKGPSETALCVAKRYVARHWNADPANAIVIDEHDSHHCWALKLRSSDITNPAYRNDCYVAVGLSERFSLIQKRPAGSLRVSVYRGRRESFSDDAVTKLTDCAPLLLAALWRHYASTGPGESRNAAPYFRTRLEKAAPSLSGRELDVCSMVAAGVTSEGIALELGVGINTVLTYRKRAYVRLGISSQNELMRMLM